MHVLWRLHIEIILNLNELTLLLFGAAVVPLGQHLTKLRWFAGLLILVHGLDIAFGFLLEFE